MGDIKPKTNANPEVLPRRWEVLSRRWEGLVEPDYDPFDLRRGQVTRRSDQLRQLLRPCDQDLLVTEGPGEDAPGRDREAEHRVARATR